MLAMKNTVLRNFLTILTTAIVAVVLAACSRTTNTTSVSSAESSPSQVKSEPTPRSVFERDLQYVRNSQFTYVWVFSRKDRHPLDKEDAAFLRTNAPQVVDWVTTEEGKKVIGGTNFDLEQGNMKLLKKRFVVEDYSHK